MQNCVLYYSNVDRKISVHLGNNKKKQTNVSGPEPIARLSHSKDLHVKNETTSLLVF